MTNAALITGVSYPEPAELGEAPVDSASRLLGVYYFSAAVIVAVTASGFAAMANFGAQLLGGIIGA